MIGSSPLIPMLPASDLERAKKWYADNLGLTPVSEDPGGVEYETGGTRFSVYASEFAGTAQNTAAGFEVADARATIAELSAKGVVFEDYDLPDLKTDADHVAEMGPFVGGWFKDSEGNILSVMSKSS